MSFPHWGAIAWGDAPTWGLLIGAGITAWYARRAFGKQSEELTAFKTEVQHGQTLIGLHYRVGRPADHEAGRNGVGDLHPERVRSAGLSVARAAGSCGWTSR